MSPIYGMCECSYGKQSIRRKQEMWWNNKHGITIYDKVPDNQADELLQMMHKQWQVQSCVGLCLSNIKALPERALTLGAPKLRFHLLCCCKRESALMHGIFWEIVRNCFNNFCS